MTIRRRIVAGYLAPAVLGLLAVVLIHDGRIRAQDTPTEKSARVVRRVPNYFGQVGLTTDQREQIYTIREEYARKLADLVRQLEEAKGEELAKCEGVLTESQKKLLDQIRSGKASGSDAATPAFAPADAPKSESAGSEPAGPIACGWRRGRRAACRWRRPGCRSPAGYSAASGWCWAIGPGAGPR